jgi:transposase
MSISEHKHLSEPEWAPTRRIEVFTGAGRRRTWSADQKAAIVADSFVEGASVCDVARRHGLTPQQLFTWRRQARKGPEAREEAGAPPLFVPALVAAPPEKLPRRTARLVKESAPTIELEVEGVTVRVGPGAQAKTITAVIRALKAAK